jgi:hypothetical protein
MTYHWERCLASVIAHHALAVGPSSSSSHNITSHITRDYNKIIIIIPLMSLGHCWGTGLPYGLHIRRTGHSPPRGPSAGWWVLTTANAAGTNSLTCLPKHGGGQDNNFFGHPSNHWPILLNFRDRTRGHRALPHTTSHNTRRKVTRLNTNFQYN